MMKPLVLYHAGCPDGFAAAWSAWRKFGDEAEYRAVSYGDPPPDDLQGRDVYILDFSYLPEFIDKMADEANQLVLLDHHKSAAEQFSAAWGAGVWERRRVMSGLAHWAWPKAIVKIAEGISGAQLAWDHFHGRPGWGVPVPAGPRPWIIDYVADRDLWQWKLPKSREVNAYLRSLPHDFAVWDTLKYVGVPVSDEATWGAHYRLGEAILQSQEREIERAVRRARTVTWGRHSIGIAIVDFDGNPIEPTEAFVSYTSSVINVTENMSEALDRLCREPPHWAVGWYQAGDGRYRYSLRSRGEGPDVAKIAEQFGGGGHRNAAGFESDKLVF